MNNFNAFINTLFHNVCDVLMTEPLCYFVGIIVLFFIAGLVRYMIYGERR